VRFSFKGEIGNEKWVGCFKKRVALTIGLRAEGRSFDDIVEKLQVSKPTLIAWSRKLGKKIQFARTLRLDALFERYAVAKAKRIETFGKRLEAILTKLDRRELSLVKTETLLVLALKYGEAMKSEQEKLEL